MIVLKDQNDTQLITQQGNYIRQELYDELEQKLEEYKQIISGLEIIKEHNMPNDTKFVILAKEDYLRNLELLNEGE